MLSNAIGSFRPAPRLCAVALGLALGGLIQACLEGRAVFAPPSAPALSVGNSPAFRFLTASDELGAPAEADRISVKRSVLAPDETLGGIVERLGASTVEATRAVASLGPHVDMRRLPPGLPVSIALAGKGGLAGVSLLLGGGSQVLAMPTHDGAWAAHALGARLTTRHAVIKGEIESSIYGFVKRGGGTDRQVADVARIFAYELDLQREVHPGDRLEIVFERYIDERGNPVRDGQIIYAAFDGKAVSRRYYRFAQTDRDAFAYYDENGMSRRKFLMRTPVNGGRLSSRFGKRRHPILGYDRMHKGVDFAASTGTPVFAAGDGVVERAGPKGSYGLYVRLRHAKGYQTAYAHLDRLAPGVRRGQRVAQGEIIGHVGSTGRSTGPHLHYEVISDGRHVDPMLIETPTTGVPLQGDRLAAFTKERERIESVRGLANPALASQTAIMLLEPFAIDRSIAPGAG